MDYSNEKAKTFLRFCDVLFALFLLIEIIYILHLPLFPSCDGPVHLYYADVLRDLLSHQYRYQHIYTIRHLIGNYSINYYALILLERFLSPAKAEEVFVAIILLNTALGFRFLAGCLGKNAPVMSLWVFPLLLSGPLSGGFFNYCFAVGMLYWALGFWVNLSQGRAGALPGFLIAFSLLALSHPVPLLVLVPFLAVDLAASWLQESHSNGHVDWRTYLLRLSVLILSVFVTFMTARHANQGGYRTSWRLFHLQLPLIAHLLSGTFLGMFGGRHILEICYQVGIVAIVPGIAFLMVKETFQRLRGMRTKTADRLLIFSLAFLSATVFFPFDLSGLFLFPVRMWSLLWPLVLACGATITLRYSMLRWLSISGVLLIAISGVVACSSLTRVARMQNEIAQIKVPAGSRVAFLEPRYVVPHGFQYYIDLWSGVRGVLSSHALLFNSPWLSEFYFPIAEAGQAGLLQDYSPERSSAEPPALAQNLIKASRERDSVLQSSDYLLYADPENGDRRLKGLIDGVLQDQKDHWSCTYGSYFALCGKKQASAENTRSPLP